ncbi:unnamed protein product [Merluccius merluccius]
MSNETWIQGSDFLNGQRTRTTLETLPRRTQRKAVTLILKFRSILLCSCHKRKELKASLTQSEIDKAMKSFKTGLTRSNLTVENLKEAELEINCFS